jgi:RNase P/RNase MRP subunit POP5
LKRVKRRYLALQVDSTGAPSRRELLNAVWAAVTRLFGEYGASLTGLSLIDYDEERKTGVLRTSLETLSSVRASLATITSVAGVDAAVHVMAVSGTIKALHKKIPKQR